MEKSNSRIQAGRFIYFLLAALFAGAVIAQVFLAGMGTFVNPSHWSQHVMLIHLFGFNVPLFMLLFAFIGSMPRRVYWQLLGLFILIFVMYFTANMTVLATWLGALHPVFAFFLTALACINVLETWKLIFKKKEKI